MVKDKTAAQRKADERQRKKDQGLIQKEIWIKPEWWQEVQLFIESLHNKK